MPFKTECWKLSSPMLRIFGSCLCLINKGDNTHFCITGWLGMTGVAVIIGSETKLLKCFLRTATDTHAQWAHSMTITVVKSLLSFHSLTWVCSRVSNEIKSYTWQRYGILKFIVAPNFSCIKGTTDYTLVYETTHRLTCPWHVGFTVTVFILHCRCRR